MNKWSLINADSGEKTWLTPRNIIVSLGHFDTDPCCPPNMPWKTADVMLTKHEDGTLAPWHGRVWLNPPYGRESYPFLERMSKHDGGVSPCCLQGQIRRFGSRSYFRLLLEYYSFVDVCTFIAQTGQMRVHLLHHLCLSRIQRQTPSPLRIAELRERL